MLGCMDRWGYHQLPRFTPRRFTHGRLGRMEYHGGCCSRGLWILPLPLWFPGRKRWRGKGGGTFLEGLPAAFQKNYAGKERRQGIIPTITLTPSISEAHHFEPNPFEYDVNWGHKQLGDTKHQQRSTPPEIDPSRSDLSLKGGHSTGSMSVVQTQCNIWWLGNRDVFLFKAFVRLSPLL